MIWLLVLLMLAIKWFLTCAVIKLITLCFGWSFSWLVATGIWLVFILINGLSSKN